MLKSFSEIANDVNELILTRLSAKLGLDPDKSLPTIHRFHVASGDHVTLIRTDQQSEAAENEHKPPTMGAHTDFGLLTLLFNRLGGLQIFTPPGVKDVAGSSQDGGWMYIRPLPGHCVVNLGDALVNLSAGVLNSSTHRVMRPPRNQVGTMRSSLAYFSHPEDGVALRALRGCGSRLIDDAAARRDAAGHVEPGVSSVEWFQKRSLPKPTREGYLAAQGTEAAGGLDYH